MTETITQSKEPLCTKPEMPIYEVPIWIYEFLPIQGGSLQGVKGWQFLVEAPNKIEARKQLTKAPSFWRNYNKATPEERKNLKPFRLRREGEIKKVPECELRHKNKHGEYTCGRVTGEYGEEDTSGEFGMCVAEGYDCPEDEDCPYNKETDLSLSYGFQKPRLVSKKGYVIVDVSPDKEHPYDKQITNALNDLIKAVNRKRKDTQGRKVVSGKLELELE